MAKPSIFGPVKGSKPTSTKTSAAKSTKTSAAPKGGKPSIFGPAAATKKTAAAPKGKGEKRFLGINLPKIPFGGPDLPAIGINTSKHNPLAQLEDLVTGLPSGMLRLGGSLAKEAQRLGGGGTIPGNITDIRSMGGRSKKAITNFREELPIATELVTSPFKTARSIADPRYLRERIQKEGVLPTALATVSDVGLIAGGAGLAGKALGAGRLAKAAELENIALAAAKQAGIKSLKGVTSADLAKVAAKTSDATKAGELVHAATKLGEAEALRSAGLATVAEKVTAGAEKVKTAGFKVGNAPADVYTKGVPFLARHTPGVAQATAKAVPGLQKAGARLGDTELAKRLHIDPKSRVMRETMRENVTRPVELAAFRSSQTAQKVRAVLDDLDAESALPYIRSGEAERLRPLLRLDDDAFAVRVKGEYGDDVNVAAFRKALAFVDDKLPMDETARIKEALTLQGKWYDDYQRNWYLSGRGDDLSEAGLAERAEQLGEGPMPTTVNRLTDAAQVPIRARLDDLAGERTAAVAELDDLRRRMAAGQGGEMSAAQRASLANKAGQVKALTDQLEREQTRLGQTVTAGESTAAATQKSIGRQVKRQEKAVASTERRLTVATKAVTDTQARSSQVAAQRLEGVMARKVTKLEDKIGKSSDALKVAADEARKSINAVPKKDAPGIVHANRIVDSLQEMADEAERAAPGSGAVFAEIIADIPTALGDVRAEFVFGGRDTAAKGAGGHGLQPRLRVRKPSERQGRQGVVPRTQAGQLEKMGKKIQQKATNEASHIVQARLGSTAGQALRSGGHTVDELGAMSGKELQAALKDANLAAWDPAGKGRPLLDPKDVTINSAVIPEHLFRTYQGYVKNTEGVNNWLLERFVDPGTRAWKHAVLALSPRWHTGNILGNVSQAMLFGGLTPGELLENVMAASTLLKKGGAGMPESLAARGGSYFDEAAGLRDPSIAQNAGGRIMARTRPTDAVRRTATKLIKKSYNANEFVDNMTKTTIYLAKKAKGYSDQTAVETALKAAGDFKNMTPFEQNVMRRVMPFYAWQRHVTQAAFRLPVTNPMRVAWTLHLVDMADRLVPDPGSEQKYQESTIGVGDKRLNLRALNPLASSGIFDPSTRSLGYSLSPFIKAASITGLGLNPASGFKPVTTEDSEFGDAPELGFGVRHPGEMAKVLSQFVPQTRQAQDMAKGESQVRADTGAEKGKASGRGRLAQLMRALGIPFPEKPDLPSLGKKKSGPRS